MSVNGFNITFITNPNAHEIVPSLKNFTTLHVPEGSSFDALPQNLTCDILLIDHYAWTENDYRLAKGRFNNLIVISDAADKFINASIIIDQNVGSTVNQYEGLHPENALMLAGPKFALLNPDYKLFRDKALKRHLKTSSVQKVLINLGSSDQSLLLSKIIKTLNDHVEGFEFNVITGASHINQNLHDRISDKNSWFFIKHTDAMASLMASADMAIGAAGFSALERCCLGLPTIQLIIADNQHASTQVIKTMGACIAIDARGPINTDDLLNGFNKLLRSIHRKGISQKSSKICDGKGAERVGKCITNLLKSRKS